MFLDRAVSCVTGRPIAIREEEQVPSNLHYTVEDLTTPVVDSILIFLSNVMMITGNTPIHRNVSNSLLENPQL